MENLHITGINLDIAWKDKERNFTNIEQHLNTKSADLFILPEMFSTGFCMEASEIAENTDKTVSWLKTMAEAKNAAFCGSVSVVENGSYYNRMYFVEPKGKVDFYDKRHLFSYSAEDHVYTKGTHRKIINYKGIRILLQICYDLRFPVFSRNNDGYDLIIYVANWPESRIFAWETLLKARAIENQCYVFGVNRIGTDGNHLNYPESSYAFDAEGKLISICENKLVSADIDLNKLKNFRNQFPFLLDRDSFIIKD